MPQTCRDCGQNTGPKRRLCKPCTLEARETREATTPLQTDAGQNVGAWIRTGETWHASVAFDGYEHEFACRDTFMDFPAADASIDHHALAHEHVCPDCRAAIDAESMPEPWKQAVADGGVALRAGETRDDSGHASNIVERQLAEADEETLAELEDEREIRTDGGQSSSGTDHSPSAFFSSRRRIPSVSTIAITNVTAIIRVPVPIILVLEQCLSIRYRLENPILWDYADRSLQPATDRSEGSQ